MKNVLIVDDTKSIRELLAKCLELNGFAPVMAENGKTALELLFRQQFDLVFLDIKLPVVSGTEVLRRMREKGVQIPVVIITAFGNIKNAVDCTRMGAVAYVQKPFTANRISSVLDELHMTDEGAARPPYMEEVRVLMQKDRFEEVKKVLQTLLSDNPLDAEVYHMLAQTCDKLKQEEEAAQYRKLYEAIRKS